MLTKVTAYSQWVNVDPLVLNIINRPDSDLFEVRNIDGLGPVKADVNTTPFGSIAGESFTGTNVGKRNIVFTIGMTPDWNDWTFSKLRRLLSKYFSPEQRIRLVFESMEFSPVEISGYIESNDPNMFSKDPEQQISIICPNLYFRSVYPVVVEGNSEITSIIDYDGTVETGFNLLMHQESGPNPTSTDIYSDFPDVATPNFFRMDGGPTPTEDISINTVPGEKYVRGIGVPGGEISNRLDDMNDISKWLKLYPGSNEFRALGNTGIQSWILTYYELHGSL